MWTGRPIDPNLQAGIAALVRAELDREAADSFRNLKRIPSSDVIKQLDYFESLSPSELAALLDALARAAALYFFPAPLIAAAHEELRTTNPALLRRAVALKSPPFSYGLRYQDLRMVRMTLNDAESMVHLRQTRATLNFQPRDDPPPELLPDPDIRRAQTAKAPLLRKLLKESLVPLLGVKPVKQLGGELVYDGAIGNTPLKVSIIFSNMYGQMHHGVTTKIFERNILAQRVTYELLWGTNVGWDHLTEENAPRSIELLSEHLKFLARLMEQIAALP